MPCRNVVKRYDSDTYYHVYNRGVEKRKIFLDEQDYAIFLSLLKRYLDGSFEKDSRGREYACLSDDVEIVAFCLMPNHFHILFYQIKIGAITKLIRSVCSSYSNYFNNKYDRVGALFQGNHKAVGVDSDGYLLYLTRYIHRNPVNYLTWEWSSLPCWTGDKQISWLKLERLSNLVDSKYLDYVNDDRDYNFSLGEIVNLIF